jgi:hypothetical protein
MNKINLYTPDDTKCGALVTLRIIPEDKTEAYWISKNYKCSIARIFREALWIISEKARVRTKGIPKSNLITEWDPLKGSIVVEDSRATRMFTLRLTEKERADCEYIAALYQSSISSVFRAGLRMLFPTVRKKMKKNKGPSFFKQ